MRISKSIVFSLSLCRIETMKSDDTYFHIVAGEGAEGRERSLRDSHRAL